MNCEITRPRLNAAATSVPASLDTSSQGVQPLRSAMFCVEVRAVVHHGHDAVAHAVAGIDRVIGP